MSHFSCTYVGLVLSVTGDDDEGNDDDNDETYSTKLGIFLFAHYVSLYVSVFVQEQPQVCLYDMLHMKASWKAIFKDILIHFFLFVHKILVNNFRNSRSDKHSSHVAAILWLYIN